MTWVFVVLIGVAVVVVALVVVGRAAAELGAAPVTSTVDLEDAVAWVGDHVAPETAAQVSYDDVRVVVGWYLDYLTDKGIARDHDGDGPVSGPMLASEDEAVAWVLTRLGDPGTPELSDDQVVDICDTQRDYLVRIGAIRSMDAPRTDPQPGRRGGPGNGPSNEE